MVLFGLFAKKKTNMMHYMASLSTCQYLMKVYRKTWI